MHVFIVLHCAVLSSMCGFSFSSFHTFLPCALLFAPLDPDSTGETGKRQKIAKYYVHVEYEGTFINIFKKLSQIYSCHKMSNSRH